MSTIINARSPYYIKYKITGEEIQSVDISIRIWSGLETSPPTPVTYSLSKVPLVIETDNYAVIEISELIRDYLYTEFYNEAQDAVWVKVDASIDIGTGTPFTTDDTYLAFDGYGYFEEGANPRQSISPADDSFTPMVLQSNMTVYFVPGRDIKIPVFSETAPVVNTDIVDGKWDGNDNFWNVVDVNWQDVTTNLNITDSDDSADKIQYVIISSDAAVTGDTITFTSTNGEAQVQTVKLVEICEPRFEKFRAVFYNKFGALQSFWLSKKSVISTSIKSENYESNTLDTSGVDVSYGILKHSKKRFQVKANQSIKTNTPLIDDTQNEPIEQMLMSEQVWLEKTEGDTLPVVVKTSSLIRKTSLNDKMVQYSVDFDYAFDKINSIR
jgi:hypothetical protein